MARARSETKTAILPQHSDISLCRYVHVPSCRQLVIRANTHGSLSVFVALVAWLMAAGSEREAAFERFDLISAALKCGGPVRCSDVKAQIALLEERGLITGKRGRLVMTEIVVPTEHAILDLPRQGRVPRGQVGTCGSRQFRHKDPGTGRCRTAAEQGAFAR